MTKAQENKKLRYELGRYRKKVMDQQKEIEELRNELEEYADGLLELSAASDALSTTVAIAFGKEQKDGSREVVIPRVNLEQCRDYILYVADGEEGYLLSAKPKN